MHLIGDAEGLLGLLESDVQLDFSHHLGKLAFGEREREVERERDRQTAKQKK